MPEKPQIPPFFYRKNSRGLTEAVEIKTGRVLCVQVTHADLLEKKWDRLVRVDTADGVVWIEKGLDWDVIPGLKKEGMSRVQMDLICEAVTSGKLLVEACEAAGVTYAEVCREKRWNKEFLQALEQAERDRAGLFVDQALTVADRSKKPYLQVETLKWAAEKGDREKFGDKKELVGQMGMGPVTFVLQTNILRPGDVGYIAPKDVTPLALEGETEVAAVVMPDFGGGKDG